MPGHWGPTPVTGALCSADILGGDGDGAELVRRGGGEFEQGEVVIDHATGKEVVVKDSIKTQPLYGQNEVIILAGINQRRVVFKKQLDDALEMQSDNKERLVGEILVTQGVISKEQLIMSMEMFLIVTGFYPEHVDEWLDQDEIDMILERINKK